MDFNSKNVKINNQDLRLLLFDSAGQEKLRLLIPIYIRVANKIIIVYEITIRLKKLKTFQKKIYLPATTTWLYQNKKIK